MNEKLTTQDKVTQQDDGLKISGYEPPQIDSVITAKDLERESLYAGFPISAPS